MESENDESHSEKSGMSSDTDQQWMEAAILRSPTKEVRLLQQMGLDDDRITNKDAEDTPACAGGGSNPTPRGMSTGDADPGAIFPSEGECRWASPIIQHTTGSTQVCILACLPLAWVGDIQ